MRQQALRRERTQVREFEIGVAEILFSATAQRQRKQRRLAAQAEENFQRLHRQRFRQRIGQQRVEAACGLSQHHALALHHIAAGVRPVAQGVEFVGVVAQMRGAVELPARERELPQRKNHRSVHVSSARSCAGWRR